MQPFELPDFYVPWPARLNPNLEAARIYSKAWAMEMGILETPSGENSSSIWSEQSFDKHDYALFCAYIHPEAPTLELNLMTAWNVWAFYVDDYFLQTFKRTKDRNEAKKYLDRILLFMPVDLGPSPVPTNPMEYGLTDLWLRTASTKSQAWRSRITESMKNLLQAFIWELESMSQQRLSNPIEYIEMRRQVGAALWSADLVEHAMFVEIPERIAFTRPIRALKNIFADAVHLRNDIFSYEREVLKAGELTNAILVFERFLRITTQDAANLVNNLLTSRLQQFEQTVMTELASIFLDYALDPIEQLNVLTYIRGLQDWQSGAHEWHIQTSRYLNPSAKQELNSNDILFIPGLPKMGIAAMHITPGMLQLSLNRFKNYKHTPYKKVGPTPLPEFYMPYRTYANENLDTVRQHSKLWARQMGMLDKLPEHPDIFIFDEHRFDSIDLALFSALFHPNVTADHLELEVFWVVWGTYADDYIPAVYGRSHDMVGAKIFYARLLEFMPVTPGIPTPIPLTPVELGLSDLWERTTATMTIEERLVFRKIIEEMSGSWIWELSNQIQNRIPDPVEYIEMRRKTCGSAQLMYFSRVNYGAGVPPKIYDTLTIQELNNAAIDYVCLTNDIYSYQREIEFEGEIHNGVLVIETFLGCDKMDAVEIIKNLMTARIKQFEHIINIELPVLFKDFELDTSACEQLIAYTEVLQRFMSASFQWHNQTDRYKEIELHRSNKSFTGYATGLGTISTRILPIVDRGDAIASLQPITMVTQQAEMLQSEISSTTKSFGISHLEPPFLKKKEEAQLD